MCVGGDMCSGMQTPLESRRGPWIPGAGVTGSCELLDVGAGNPEFSKRAKVLLAAEPSLQPPV